MYRQEIFCLAHEVPRAGHLVREKTFDQLVDRCYWPGVLWDIADYYTSSLDCQLSQAKGLKQASLVPLPLVETPFERIELDLVDPYKRVWQAISISW